MTSKLRKRHLLFVVTAICLLHTSAAYPHSKKSMEEPISKEGLFKALETTLTDSGAKHLINRIQERGVSYKLSDSDKEKIGSLQKGIGQKRLNELIKAIEKNYRADVSRTSESTAPQKQEPPPTVLSLRYYAEEMPSTNEKLPYGLRVIIQTNIPFSPVHIIIQCDGPIGQYYVSAAQPPGSITTMQKRDSRYILLDDGTVFDFYWREPAFAPDAPLEAHLWSATKLRVINVVPVL